MRPQPLPLLLLPVLVLTACVRPLPAPERPAPRPPTPPSAGPPRVPAPRPSVPVDPGRMLFGIDEGVRNDRVLAESGATWQRVVLPWSAIQPTGPDDFGHLGQTLPADLIEAQLDRGVRIAGLLQFTPAWAQTNPDQGERSPPRGLQLPFDDPRNAFGRFAYETARYYAGRIDEWIIWNEPEFKPGGPGAGDSFTWLGTEEQYAQLLKVAYLAIKRANPNATVSFAGTSYWTDAQAGRPQYYERVLAILAQDPGAREQHFFHDAVSVNLYRAPDDVVRVHRIFKAIQARWQLDLPVWLTETNAMPTDDLQVRCGHADDAIQTTMDQQAAFAVQAFALAAAAGYRRVGLYQMVDDDPCHQPSVWGAIRDDGSRRPVADALRTAITTFGDVRQARFVPLARLQQAWPAWPTDPTSNVPNWEIYQVALDLPQDRRVTVVWNGDAQTACVGIKASGRAVRVMDKLGRAQVAPTEREGAWWLTLGPASAHAPGDPDGYHFIGGDPLLLIEDGVPPTTPVAEPAAGCVTEAGFLLAVAPAGGQTVHRGEVAEFTLRARGQGGFAAPLALRVREWSTQRFPTPRSGATLPLQLTLPERLPIGQPVTVHLGTTGVGTGIYYVVLEASGDGKTQSIELALVVD
jgi:hypothetical protein